MSRSPTYPNLRDWILGRIKRHPSSTHSMPAYMLEKPPGYLLSTALDAQDELRKLRDEGLIASHSRRWYLLRKGSRFRDGR